MSRRLLILCHVVIYGAVLVPDPPGTAARWVLAAFLAAVLIWASTRDFESFEIPDLASLALVLIGIAGLWLPAVWPVADRLAGALIWPAIFWAVSEGYARWRGRVGLGFGDVKLMAGVGLMVGFGGGVLVLLVAALGGIAFMVSLAVLRRQSLDDLGQSAVAFGPFLCLSTWVVWLAGGA